MIKYESDKAAKFVKNISGWVSNTGRFWGKDEHMARWDGCTHQKCTNCRKYIEKNRRICSDCYEKINVKNYKSKSHKDWDGETMLYSYALDKYYSDEDTLKDDCEEFGIKISDAMLVICEPEYLHEIETDIWEDHFPDDIGDDCIPKTVLEALENLNQEIRDSRNDCPISWYPGKFRTAVE